MLLAATAALPKSAYESCVGDLAEFEYAPQRTSRYLLLAENDDCYVFGAVSAFPVHGEMATTTWPRICIETEPDESGDEPFTRDEGESLAWAGLLSHSRRDRDFGDVRADVGVWPQFEFLLDSGRTSLSDHDVLFCEDTRPLIKVLYGIQVLKSCFFDVAERFIERVAAARCFKFQTARDEVVSFLRNSESQGDEPDFPHCE